jgi:hypothetical protein
MKRIKRNGSKQNGIKKCEIECVETNRRLIAEKFMKMQRNERKKQKSIVKSRETDGNAGKQNNVKNVKHNV